MDIITLKNILICSHQLGLLKPSYQRIVSAIVEKIKDSKNENVTLLPEELRMIKRLRAEIKRHQDTLLREKNVQLTNESNIVPDIQGGRSVVIVKEPPVLPKRKRVKKPISILAVHLAIFDEGEVIVRDGNRYIAQTEDGSYVNLYDNEGTFYCGNLGQGNIADYIVAQAKMSEEEALRVVNILQKRTGFNKKDEASRLATEAQLIIDTDQYREYKKESNQIATIKKLKRNKLTNK